jgi:hypothetical protein
MANPIPVKSSSDTQLFASAGATTPAYGMGAREYRGGQVRGREAHVQIREQNSGMIPAEDYRASKLLPSLWTDLDRNGCPYVMQGGQITGVAGIDDGTNSIKLVHQVAPANAGIPQQVIYGKDDLGLTVDIDAAGTVLATGTFDPSVATGRVTESSDGYANAEGSTRKLIGNKPLAYTPTNVLSTGWSDLFVNQKFDEPVTMKTQWLTMYPVDDLFMYGGALALSGADVNVDKASVGMSRASLGYAPAVISGAADAALGGIQAGDLVMPNPYLPGKLISVSDFVELAIKDTGTAASGGVANQGIGGDGVGLADAVAVSIGGAVDDVMTYANAYAYAMEHVVGRCFKRQARAEFSGGKFINKDINTEIMSFMTQVPDLNLQGKESDGFEADQEAARQFAQLGLAGADTADVVFINFNIK